MDVCMMGVWMNMRPSARPFVYLSVCLDGWMFGCMYDYMFLLPFFWIHDFILVFIDGVCATNFLRVLCGNVTMIMTMI